MSRITKSFLFLATLLIIALPTAMISANSLARSVYDEFEYDENERPILSGEELILDTEHFRIHYTQSGSDAAYSIEFVEEVALALEESWKTEFDELGWQAPPPDSGFGGDDRYDVYIKYFKDKSEYGHVVPDMLLEPCSPDPTVNLGIPSYMVIDNNFTRFERDSEDFDYILKRMRSTVAHELNHASQYSYDQTNPPIGLWSQRLLGWKILSMINTMLQMIPTMQSSNPQIPAS